MFQILYFDSVRMGSLSRPRGILPRVKAYDSKSLSLMITADKASSSSGSENPTWGSTVVCFSCNNNSMILWVALSSCFVALVAACCYP